MYVEQKIFASEIAKLRNTGMIDSAIELCRQAALQFPNDSFFPKLLGDIYRQNECFQEAAVEYLKTLKLIRPNQFQIFVKAYRNLEKSTSEDFMHSFKEEIREILEKDELPEELKKNLNSLLGINFILGSNFLSIAEQANNDQNFRIVQKMIEEWESKEDITKIEALVAFKLNATKDSQSKKIDTFLIQRLEKLGKHDLALSMIQKTKRPYQEKLIVVAILRICRKKSDYSFAEKELQIDEKFIESSDFNIQYELVYYFRTTNDSERLEKTLRLMRDRSATSSVPIARTLYNFYLSLNRFEDAQSIYEHIRQLEQDQASEREQHKKRRTKGFFPEVRNRWSQSRPFGSG